MGAARRPVGRVRAGLLAVRMPAALLLGPMIAGILWAANGGAVRIPRLAYLCARRPLSAA